MAARLWTVPPWGQGADPGRALRAWRERAAGLGGVLWRHKLPMLGCILVALGLAAAYLSGRTPLYRATALLALDRASSARPGQLRDGNVQDELRRIESRASAAQLVNRLDLHFVPEFQPALASAQASKDPWLPPPILQWLPEPFAEALGAGAVEGEITDEQRAARWRDGAIETAMARTRAEVVRPLVLGLHFASADPHLAAAGANALAELYLEGQPPRQRVAPEDRTRLAAEIERLRARIRKTEQAIAAARAIAREGGQRLRELTGELAIWRRERAEVEARLHLTEAALASGAALDAGMPASARDRLAALRAREAELGRALAEQHGEDGAQVVQLRAALQALQNQRRGQIQRIVSSLQREIEIIRSREAALEAEIKGVGGQDARDEPGAGADPFLLEQKLQERARLQERLMQLEAQAAGSLWSARILKPAIVPDQPVQPRPAMIYGVALAGGVLFGVVVAFALESVRRARA